METLERKSLTLETSANVESEALSDYEQCRQRRIKENMERMRKLGLFHLSSQFNSQISSSKKRTFQKRTHKKSSSLPPRRSSRLQDTPSVNYAENSKMIEEEDRVRKCSDEQGRRSEKRVRKCDDEQGRRPEKRVRNCGDEQGRRPEIYTEEHEKLLGSCESSWDLCVDSGRRVYDQVKGKSCHQCRQKTLGHRTNCNRCKPSVQGQFCGDCLHLRYGENLLEANQNPNWICPPCRGICNCSLCRHAKGWAPTGAIHREVVSLGYKSVAHYLIKTRRAETVTESEQGLAIKSKDTKEDNLQVMSDDGKQATPKPVHKEITLYYVRRRFRQKKNVMSDSSGGQKDEPDNKSRGVLEVGLGSVGEKISLTDTIVQDTCEPQGAIDVIIEDIPLLVEGDVSIYTSKGRENEYLSETNELEGESPRDQLLKENAAVNIQLGIGKGGSKKKMPQWMAQVIIPRFTREDREPLIKLLPKGLKLGKNTREDREPLIKLLPKGLKLGKNRR